MTENKPEIAICTAEAIRAQAVLILKAWGMNAEDAELTAGALSDCDLRGIETHGISLLALYALWIKARPFNLAAQSKLERDGAGFALLDGQGGLGYAVSVRAMKLAVAKARITGIAGVAVRNSRHFGAAGYYARLGAQAGMLTLVTTSTRVVSVVPPGARAPMLGTNPLAYGIPRGKGDPVVFDMATATVAGNKVRMRALKNMPLPEGWVVDDKGAPVIDPHHGTKIIFETGAGGLTPLGASSELGSHKGFGLALLVHFLGGTLAGASFPASSQRPDDADDVGHFFLAIDPNVYRDASAFHGDVEDVVATLRAAPPVDPKRPVRIPGDLESRIYADRVRNGVPMPMGVVRQLANLSRELGIDFPLYPPAAQQASRAS